MASQARALALIIWPVAANFGARLIGLLAVAVATLIIGRSLGPAGVGTYTLLRLLPWLLGVALCGGLPGAVPYFVAGQRPTDRGLRPTILALALGAGITGWLLWLAMSRPIAAVFFHALPVDLLDLAAPMVLTRVVGVTLKACAQAFDDLPGSNLIIVLEDVAFLPAFAGLTAAGVTGDRCLVLALLAGSALTAGAAFVRLASRGFFRSMSLPSWSLAREIVSFSTRGYVGTLMSLVNLRLDFAVLSVIAGPATLGVYAVASKYAELLRLLPVAMNWVLYPRYVVGKSTAADLERTLRRALALSLALAVPLGIAAPFVFDMLYGPAFQAAAVPAQILLLGLLGEGAAAIAAAFLVARGRPGLNSLATGTGFVVTIALDWLLIPRYGAIGAAWASAVAYITTSVALVMTIRRAFKGPAPAIDAVVDGLPSIGPPLSRRVVDVIVASAGLVVLAPVMFMVALAARHSTGASALFRQPRVGQGGRPFVLLKFRTMVPAPGSEVTAKDDPRITRLGGLLRRTKLDELPQLVNVLRGDMTLVGPRPESVALARRYAPQHRFIFSYRPGLTGPVQLQFAEDVAGGMADVDAYYLTRLVPVREALDWSYLANPDWAHTAQILLATAVRWLPRPARRRWPRLTDAGARPVHGPASSAGTAPPTGSPAGSAASR